MMRGAEGILGVVEAVLFLSGSGEPFSPMARLSA